MISEGAHQSPRPWFRGEFFVAGRPRICAVCGLQIKPNSSAIANHELRQCAHLGCGTIHAPPPAKETRPC